MHHSTGSCSAVIQSGAYSPTHFDYEKTNFGSPLMQMAKSLVMKPASMVLMQTASSASENTLSSALLSSFARWSRPRVHAKMEAEENT